MIVDGYVYVECNDCGYKGLVSLFVGECVEDVVCSRCGSDSVDIN